MRPAHAVAVVVGAAALLGAAGAALLALVRFGAPVRLAALAVPWAMVCLFVGWLAWRDRFARSIGHGPTVRALSPRWSARRQVARAAATIVGAALVVVAWARPQWGEQVREVQRAGIDVVFALDISRSMLATDLAPSRLDAARAEMERLMQRLDGDRVGLVVFAGLGFVQSPLTSDYGAIRLYLDRLHPDDLPVQGTAIGRALTESTRLLIGGESSAAFQRAASQLIIVFTDGEDHETDPIGAAVAAQAEGIDVYTVGIGTAEGSRIPIHDSNGNFREFLSDRSGQVVVTRLEEAQLREIAAQGGGEYVPMNADGAAAAALERAISAYDEVALSSMLRTQYEERFLFFLIPGALLVLLGTALPSRRPSRRGVASAVAVCAAALGGATTAGCEGAWMRADPRVEAAIAIIDDATQDGSSDGSADGSAAAEALAELARVPEDGRALPSYHYATGWVHEQSAAALEAQSAYLRALNADDVEAQVRALFALGNALLAQQQYEASIERYRRVLQLDATHDGARRNLEIALLRQFPPCVALDDPSEDNDDGASAASLPASVYQGDYLPPGVEPGDAAASAPSFVACGGDADWFVIPVVGGSTLSVEVTLQRLRDDTGQQEPPSEIAPTDVRIALVGMDGVSPLAVDQGLDDGQAVPAQRVRREVVDATIPANIDADGRVFLRVDVDGELEYRYDLKVTLVPPCWALEDAFETNDSAQVATALPSGDHNARICASNADWYKGGVVAGDNLFFVVRPPERDDGEPGAVDVQWSPTPDGPPGATVRVDERYASFAIRDATETAEGYGAVMSADETEGDYRVSLYHYPPCPMGNDRYEPNEQPQQATALKLDEDPLPLLHLRVCDGDFDWYQVPLPPVDEDDREGKERRPFSALVTVDGAAEQWVAAIYDPANGQLLARSVPIALAPAPAQQGATEEVGVVAYAELPWEQEAVVVVVSASAQGFYNLDFPYTEAQQAQGGGASGEGDGEEGEQQESDAEQGTEGQPTDAAEEEPPGDDEAEAGMDEGGDEEAQSLEELMQLLNALEPEGTNLPLQQALENAPTRRMQNEW